MPTERIHLASPVTVAGERVIASPFQFEVRGEDNLRLNTWSQGANETITLALRFRDAAGGLQVMLHTHNTGASPYMKASTLFKLAPGFLLSANLQVTTAAGNMRRGDLFAQLELVRGFAGAVVSLGTLLQGYVAREASLAWPGSPIQNPHEGPGRPIIVGFSNPAAGVEFVGTVPTGVRWRFMSFHALLNTSAAAGTRTIAFVIPNSPTFAGIFPTTADQIAGQSIRYIWVAGGSADSSAQSFWQLGTLPEMPVFVAGDKWQVLVSGIQAGDQLDHLRLYCEQWLDP